MARYRAEQAAGGMRGSGPPWRKNGQSLYLASEVTALRFLVVKNRDEHIFALAEAAYCATRIKGIRPMP
jgi:hypothetical protein